jgi:endonuclease/exonuclease/phosphatase family metal-dependent hydrolase
MGKRAVSRLFYYYSILLTAFIGGLALCGAYGGHVAPEKSIFLSVATLALPVTLLLNLAMVIYWGLRLRVWALIPLFCIFYNADFLKSVFRVQPAPLAQDMPKSLVMSTYNVAVFNNEPTGFSCKAIAQYLEDCQVDIACFQEFGINPAFNEDSVKNVFKNWEYCSIPRPQNGESILQTAIFSKYPILSSRLITFNGTANCAQVCEVLVVNDTMRVVNNHLQTTDVRRNKKRIGMAGNVEGVEADIQRLTNDLTSNSVKRGQQADYIAKVIDESQLPTIVCGDFNSIPSEYPYHKIKGNRFEDGFRLCGSGYMYTYRFLKHLLRIDFMFVPKEFKGYKFASPNLDYSDHKPVIMAMGYK